MRLPNTAQTSRPWRIHELTQDFRLEDVWALPTPGGADEFGRLVHLIASGDPSRGSPRAVRMLWAIRWKVGKLLRWDSLDAGSGAPIRDWLPADLRAAPSGSDFAALPFTSLYLARRRVGGGDRQSDHARHDARRLGPGRDGRLPWPAGRLREAKRAARNRLHGCDQAIPALDRVPADAAANRPGLAGRRTSVQMIGAGAAGGSLSTTWALGGGSPASD
jgi:hypothetical protein